MQWHKKEYPVELLQAERQTLRSLAGTHTSLRQTPTHQGGRDLCQPFGSSRMNVWQSTQASVWCRCSTNGSVKLYHLVSTFIGATMPHPTDTRDIQGRVERTSVRNWSTRLVPPILCCLL